MLLGYNHCFSWLLNQSQWRQTVHMVIFRAWFSTEGDFVPQGHF